MTRASWPSFAPRRASTAGTHGQIHCRSSKRTTRGSGPPAARELRALRHTPRSCSGASVGPRQHDFQRLALGPGDVVDQDLERRFTRRRPRRTAVPPQTRRAHPRTRLGSCLRHLAEATRLTDPVSPAPRRRQLRWSPNHQRTEHAPAPWDRPTRIRPARSFHAVYGQFWQLLVYHASPAH